jgi:hypothetical protein
MANDPIYTPIYTMRLLRAALVPLSRPALTALALMITPTKPPTS